MKHVVACVLLGTAIMALLYRPVFAQSNTATPSMMGNDVVVRSDVMLGIIRIYEVLAKERNAKSETWPERLAWFRQHFRVSAGLSGTAGEQTLEVVTLNDSPTVLGGNRVFRVNMKTGEVTEGEPGR